jgi:hypothetical protein
VQGSSWQCWMFRARCCVDELFAGELVVHEKDRMPLTSGSTVADLPESRCIEQTLIFGGVPQSAI